MADNKDLPEIVAEILIELQKMNGKMNKLDSIDSRLERVEKHFEQVDSRLERVEGQQAKNNAAVGEIRFSVVKLAEQLEVVQKFDERIKALESVVFRKGA